MAQAYPDGNSREEWLRVIEAKRNPFLRYPADPNVPIWRYMDFAKFVSLLHASALFFPRASILGDPFEGSATVAHSISRRTRWESVIAAMRNRTDEQRSPDWEAEIRKEFKDMDESETFDRLWLRDWTYVSCWHVNTYESAAMWKLYGGQGQSIAVVSTFQRLKDCLTPYRMPPHGEPTLGLVRYIDYSSYAQSEYEHYLSHFFLKRKSFEHEAELRAVIQDIPLKPTDNPNAFLNDYSVSPTGGRSLTVDLVQLIQTIRVAPEASEWFYEIVQSVVNKYGLNIEVQRSQLDARPLF